MTIATIVKCEPFAGIGKQTNRPYSGISVSAIFQSDDGQIEVGEVRLFDRDGVKHAPIPVNTKVTPIVTFRNNKGNVMPEISGFAPVAK